MAQEMSSADNNPTDESVDEFAAKSIDRLAKEVRAAIRKYFDESFEDDFLLVRLERAVVHMSDELLFEMCDAFPETEGLRIYDALLDVSGAQLDSSERERVDEVLKERHLRPLLKRTIKCRALVERAKKTLLEEPSISLDEFDDVASAIRALEHAWDARDYGLYVQASSRFLAVAYGHGDEWDDSRGSRQAFARRALRDKERQLKASRQP